MRFYSTIITVFISVLLAADAIAQVCAPTAPVCVPGNGYAFRYALDTDFGLKFNTTTLDYEFTNSVGSAVLGIDAITGNISIPASGALQVGPNRYAFQFSLTPNYGLFFNAAGLAYEFRTSSAAPIFSIGANSGNITTLGAAGIGTTSPTAKLQVGNNTAGNNENYIKVSTSGVNTPPIGLTRKAGIQLRHFNNENWGMTLESVENSAAGSVAGLVIKSHFNDPVGIERMYINRHNGHVGIGTLQPGEQLQVGDSDSTETYIKISCSGVNTEPLGVRRKSGIKLRDFDNENWGFNIENVEDTSFSALSITAVFDSVETERVHIDRPTGFMGVGTSNPLGRVHAHQSEGLFAGVFTSDVQTSAAHIVHSEYTGDTVFADVRGIYSQSTPRNYYGIGMESFGGWFGVFGLSQDDGSGFVSSTGIYGECSGSSAPGQSSSHYGIYGYADAVGSDTTVTNYGVYGQSGFSSGTNYAGYFNGNVTVTGTFSNPSDENLKINIADLEGTLESLTALKVHQYEFDREQYDFMNLPEGTQYGLIAQEVEKVFPELVKKNVHAASDPKATDRPQHDRVEYKSVNYMGLIPLMVQAINEQTEKIEALEVALSNCCISHKTGHSLNQEINNSTNESWLGQNVPNPFDRSTTIQYFVPESSAQSTMKIFDLGGREIKSYDLAAGYGQVQFNHSELAPGTYVYSLINDGMVIATKKMIMK